ncbi:hypothetical protein V6N13_040847 [Hibiscus sabdariffa]
MRIEKPKEHPPYFLNKEISPIYLQHLQVHPRTRETDKFSNNQENEVVATPASPAIGINLVGGGKSKKTKRTSHPRGMIPVATCLTVNGVKGVEDILNKECAFELSTMNDTMYFIADFRRKRRRIGSTPSDGP